MGRYRVSTPKTALGSALLTAMEIRGFNMVELSERTKGGALRSVSVSMISRILAGERSDPALSVVQSLEKALGCRLDSFSGEKEAPVIEDFERFRGTPLGQSLQLSVDEIRDLEGRPWYRHDEHPTDDQWYEWIKLRRSIKKAQDPPRR